MNNTRSLALAAAMALILTACSGTTDVTDAPPKPTSEPPSASTPVEAKTESTLTTADDAGANELQEEEEVETLRIKLTVGDRVLTATLYDNQTTRDFISLLPLTLTFSDYAGTEKVSDLPKRLSVEGAPSGSDPSFGDIAYYAPWGNLAIYYRDFGYSNGLVVLGKVDDGTEALHLLGSEKVKVERVNLR